MAPHLIENAEPAHRRRCVACQGRSQDGSSHVTEEERLNRSFSICAVR
jgi:hypothetical protein